MMALGRSSEGFVGRSCAVSFKVLVPTVRDCHLRVDAPLGQNNWPSCGQLSSPLEGRVLRVSRYPMPKGCNTLGRRSDFPETTLVETRLRYAGPWPCARTPSKDGITGGRLFACPTPASVAAFNGTPNKRRVVCVCDGWLVFLVFWGTRPNFRAAAPALTRGKGAYRSRGHFFLTFTFGELPF